MIRMSGFRAFTFVSVVDMSDKSAGSWSSIMIFMPYSLILSITPALTSIENGSPSNANATRTSDGDLKFFFLSSAAIWTAEARYCSDVESTANRYLYPCVNKERDAPSASTIGTPNFSDTGAIAFVMPELYGPSIYSTPSCWIRRSASWAPRAGVDSSS